MAFSKNQSSLKEQVFEVVKKIPCGKVATYGDIASIIQKSKIKNQNKNAYSSLKVNNYNSKFKISKNFLPRLVGFTLHKNKDPKVPCHRVVDRNGRLAPNFGFGGSAEQKRRLEVEGVRFKYEMHVELATTVMARKSEILISKF